MMPIKNFSVAYVTINSSKMKNQVFTKIYSHKEIRNI